MEDAFRLNVKWSLQEISKAINGDGKSSPNPLFRIKVILQSGKHGAQEVKSCKFLVMFQFFSLSYQLPSLLTSLLFYLAPTAGKLHSSTGNLS